LLVCYRECCFANQYPVPVLPFAIFLPFSSSKRLLCGIIICTLIALVVPTPTTVVTASLGQGLA
jgi:hypothetical protein